MSAFVKTFLYLGKEYTLHTGNHTSISLHEDRLLFPHVLQFRLEKEITTWYIQQARSVISNQVEYYSKHMNTIYASLKFSDTISQWGSCSRDNNLQFNWRLIMAPLLVLNYVIIHELTHTLEKNHSSNFWSKVRLHNPSYKQQIKWLQTHGNSLKIPPLTII